MEALARPVTAEPLDDTLETPSIVDAYCLRVRAEQFDYLTSVAEAASMLDGQSAQVANLAAVHGRLTQQFFDAQRLILKRRADAHAAVVRIAADAEATVDAILREARGSDPTDRSADDDSAQAETDPLGIWAATDGVARSIDRAFDRETDDVVIAQGLRTLLDEWWRIESQEDQAAIDDANARAAIRVHIAEIEAREISKLTEVRLRAAALPPPLRSAEVIEPVVIAAEIEAPAPVSLPKPPLVHTSRTRLDADPMLAALEAADHAGLDSVLASLLDTLDDRCEPPPWENVLADAAGDEADQVQLGANDLRIRCDIADSEVVDHGRQEAFDRFWNAFRAGAGGTRDMLIVRVMLPAVAVVALVALVLAWVG